MTCKEAPIGSTRKLCGATVGVARECCGRALTEQDHHADTFSCCLSRAGGVRAPPSLCNESTGRCSGPQDSSAQPAPHSLGPSPALTPKGGLLVHDHTRCHHEPRPHLCPELLLAQPAVLARPTLCSHPAQPALLHVASCSGHTCTPKNTLGTTCFCHSSACQLATPSPEDIYGRMDALQEGRTGSCQGGCSGCSQGQRVCQTRGC